MDVDEKPWARFEREMFNHGIHFVQIVPVDDILEHELSPSCWCAPSREDFKQMTWYGHLLTLGMMWTHNAMDGRD